MNFKKIISFMLLCSLVISSFVIGIGASNTETELDTQVIAEENPSESTSTRSASYKYRTFINDIYYDCGSDQPFVKINAPFSISSIDKPFEYDFSSSGNLEITFLRVSGWFLTDYGVRKYAVRISSGDETIEYDVHNYMSEDYISSGVDSAAQNDGLADYLHNAMYDIDVYLDDFKSDTVTITLLAYTFLGEILPVWNINDFTVFDNSDGFLENVICRYCKTSFVSNPYQVLPYSHRNCAYYFNCEICQKDTLILPLHDFEDDSQEACSECGLDRSLMECVIDPSTIVYVAKDDNYHTFSYKCEGTDSSGGVFGCGAVSVIEPHTVVDGVCSYCTAHIHDWVLDNSTNLYDSVDCVINSYKCSYCDATREETLQHNSNGCKCINCGYMFSACSFGSSYNSEFLYHENVCFEKVFICDICGEGVSHQVSHTYIDGICTACGYGDVSEPETDTAPESEPEESDPKTENGTSNNAGVEEEKNIFGKLIDFFDNVKSKAAPLIAIFVVIDLLILGYFVWKWLFK